MNPRKSHEYFQVTLVLALFLLLWNPLPTSSFSQYGGGDAENTAGDKAGSVTMQTVSGRVVDTINSGGYTYALVEDDGAMTWVALPKGRIKAGNEITCQPGMVMNNFRSTSLNRIFKHIVFSSGLTSFAEGTAPPETTPDEATGGPKTKEPEDWTDL